MYASLVGFKARVTHGQERFTVRPGLALRPILLDDAEEFYRCVDKNRSYLREWMPWLDTTQSVDRLRFFLQSCVDGYADGSSFRLAILVDGKIGGVVALEEIRSMHGTAKIGYWLSGEHQGSGIMTAAVRVLIDYAFGERDLQTLALQAATENARSRSVAERIGMTYEGILRQREWLYDHYVDLATYSLLADEWRMMGCGTQTT